MTDKETAMKELLALYKDYCQELDQYDDETYPAGQDEKVFRQYQRDEQGIEPMSPALAGGLFTTESPGMSCFYFSFFPFSVSHWINQAFYGCF